MGLCSQISSIFCVEIGAGLLCSGAGSRCIPFASANDVAGAVYAWGIASWVCTGWIGGRLFVWSASRIRFCRHITPMSAVPPNRTAVPVSSPLCIIGMVLFVSGVLIDAVVGITADDDPLTVAFGVAVEAPRVGVGVVFVGDDEGLGVGNVGC